MRVGVKASTSTPLSAEHQESTMFQTWGNYPSILQTLVNHQLYQSIMKGTHLEDTDNNNNYYYYLIEPQPNNEGFGGAVHNNNSLKTG